MDFMWDKFNVLEISAETIVIDDSGFVSELSMVSDSVAVVEGSDVFINKTCDKPIHLIVVGDNTRVNLKVKANNTIVESILSRGVRHSIEVLNGAKVLNYAMRRVDMDSNDNWAVSIGANSELKNVAVVLVNANLNYISDIKMIGEGSKFNQKALVKNYKDFRFNSDVSHLISNNSAELELSVVAVTNSKTNIRGNAIVGPGLTGVNNSIDFKALCEPEIDFIEISPNQNINSESVEAKHGASIGHNDRNQIWFLEAAGMDRHDADLALQAAFENSIIMEIDNEVIKSEIQKKLTGSSI